MAIESEIKYTVPDKALFDTIKSFSEIACYTSVDRGTAQHTDTYFDTSGFRLYHEKIVLRLRITVSGSILTFKAQGPPGEGFLRRIEIETPADITAEDIAQGRIPDIPPFEALYDRIGIVNLSQSLRVINDRHTILLQRGEEAHYELVLDDVTFCGQKGTRKILELEVESLIGADDDLRRIGKWLEERFDLKPAGPSKYILGMELVGGIM